MSACDRARGIGAGAPRAMSHGRLRPGEIASRGCDLGPRWASLQPWNDAPSTATSCVFMFVYTNIGVGEEDQCARIEAELWLQASRLFAASRSFLVRDERSANATAQRRVILGIKLLLALRLPSIIARIPRATCVHPVSEFVQSLIGRPVDGSGESLSMNVPSISTERTRTGTTMALPI